ncbi:fasciclin domain-containing protein [Flavimarina sp. Hel_I_48]|uniref:fasciclin domain-containing protein n=1 Tax=Flavimarina sp. Hel_I_48 TaxID=1392488 RepID=UPI0004DF9694|nr:fasciclin domain-containing protein [Flavimarina sp. Hel_I_48]
MKKLITGLAAVALLFSACKENKKTTDDQMDSTTEEQTMTTDTETMEDGETVADIAMSNDQFSTLVQGVQAAGLGETLQSDGPFTIFAPTNQAFSKLPEGTLETLLKPENKEKLTGILTYHVVAGEYGAADITKAIKENDGEFEITTLEGGKLIASLDGDKVIVTDANDGQATVEQADIKGSNGVIHGINTVLMPKN